MLREHMSHFDAESASPRVRREEILLIERAKRRDPAAMRQLIDLHKDRLFAFVWRMVRNHHDAEEICQEAFLKAFAALGTFNADYRFSTWVFTIAYRLTLNTARKKKPLTADVDFAALAGGEQAADERSAASEEARKLHALVWNAVGELTDPQRAAVLLFYKQEQSCQDIAAVLDIPVATVKSHLHRARARLKTLIEAQLAEDSSGDRILREFAG